MTLKVGCPDRGRPGAPRRTDGSGPAPVRGIRWGLGPSPLVRPGAASSRTDPTRFGRLSRRIGGVSERQPTAGQQHDRGKRQPKFTPAHGIALLGLRLGNVSRSDSHAIRHPEWTAPGATTPPRAGKLAQENLAPSSQLPLRYRTTAVTFLTGFGGAVRTIAKVNPWPTGP